MVMENAADDLLAGPRGRRLCLEFVNFMGGPASDESDPIGEALFWGARERDVGASTGVRYAILSNDESAGGNEGSIPSAPPVEEIARILEADSLTVPTEAALAECLGAAVESARYWQEPDGYDMLAAEPALRPQLLRIARAIVDSAPAAWWSHAIEMDDQWVVTFDGGLDAPSATARQVLDDWRDAAEREESDWRSYHLGPGAQMSGSGWSTPPGLLVKTTGSRGEHGPMGLLTVAGYLNAAGWAIPVDDEQASVLGGWDPDETVWLRDGAADPRRSSQAWTCDDEGEWHVV